MSERRKKEPSMFRVMLAERGIKDMQGIHDLVKELTAEVIQEALDVELEETLATLNTTTRTSRLVTAATGIARRQ